MATTDSSTFKERILFAVCLSLSSLVGASSAIFMLIAYRVPANMLIFLALPTLLFGFVIGVVVTGALSSATRYSIWCRLRAAAAGFVGLIIAGSVVEFLGLKHDALSHDVSVWAILEEFVVFSFAYGSMFATTFLALGRPVPDCFTRSNKKPENFG